MKTERVDFDLLDKTEIFVNYKNLSRYLFSNFGRIFDKKKNKVLTLIPRKNSNYLYSYLTTDDDKCTRYTIKYLIYKIFIDSDLNPNALIKHKDENMYNLHMNNLFATKLNQHAFIDLTGKTFGRLTVLKRVENKGISKCWECVCVCGIIKNIRATSLISGGTKSCGCLFKECAENKKILLENLNFRWKGYEEIAGNFWSHIKKHAVNRNYSFEITIKDAWNVFIRQNKKCALSNIDLIMKGSTYRTASLDRIDNTKGYTIDNIQWVHKDINIMKNDHNQDYFIDLCKKVALNN